MISPLIHEQPAPVKVLRTPWAIARDRLQELGFDALENLAIIYRDTDNELVKMRCIEIAMKYCYPTLRAMEVRISDEGGGSDDKPVMSKAALRESLKALMEGGKVVQMKPRVVDADVVEAKPEPKDPESEKSQKEPVRHNAPHD